MKVIFAGTPVFAARALEAMIAAGFDVPLVLTQPDRPSGRGLKLTPSAVKQVAAQHNIEVAQPTSLKLDGKYPLEAQAARERIIAAQADLMVVAAYGLILPQDVLDLPTHGCLNIHASLLPRWRGAAPIHRAIQAGDAQTGVTLMQMDAGLDTGDMLAMERINIGAHTQASLHDELAAMGARMTVDYVHALANNAAPAPVAQPLEGVTYADKISKSEARLNWAESAQTLERKIRAFNPAPAALAVVDDEVSFKVFAAQVVSDEIHPAGTVLRVDKCGIDVACGQGVLRIIEAQRAGGKRLPVAQFVEGFALRAGQVLLSSGD
ncbi:MAG: methionyl-tRNA formyltransferase [Formosimonas sp.]